MLTDLILSEMKKLKFIALALTTVLTLSLTVGTYAYNKKTAAIHTVPNHFDGGNCPTCTPENIDTNEFECNTTPNEPEVRCECLNGTPATTAFDEGAEQCLFLYKHPVMR